MRAIIGRVPKQFLMGLLVAGLMAAYGWVGKSDYEQAQANLDFYCQMEAQHIWPKRADMHCPAPPLVPGERLVAL
ncbi:hypothetical protein ACIPL1_27520 [Pseudomonas sp. NPDC090202]|uniref:hypothetical protein n=1 Tax=Pseudomonas sp. NPDC090202 TaxID=3364476 RepID=UPI0037F715F4